MTLTRLALSNISGSAFRSWVIFLCVLVVAGFSLTTTVQPWRERSWSWPRTLGADIIVVPQLAKRRWRRPVDGHATLSGCPATSFGPSSPDPGVAVAVAQNVPFDAKRRVSCCSVRGDFPARPTSRGRTSHSALAHQHLRRGHLASGARHLCFHPRGRETFSSRLSVTLIANLEPTAPAGQSMFHDLRLGLHDVARISYSRPEKPLVILPTASLPHGAPEPVDWTSRRRHHARRPGRDGRESPDLFLAYRSRPPGCSAASA